MFLILGVIIATFFSESKHESYQQLILSHSDSLVFATICDTANAVKWIENAFSIKPEKKSSKKGEFNYRMVFLDEGNQKRELKQTWIVDSTNRSVTIISIIPNKLEMSNTISMDINDDKTTLLKSNIVLDVHGWTNRLLLSGASSSLLQRQKAELHSIDSLCHVFKK